MISILAIRVMSYLGGVSPQAESRLGYLLKHAMIGFGDLTQAALEPLGIDNREWATLASLDERRPLPQVEVAKRAGIDRTTMVALVDSLETRGLVVRRPDPADRRRNLVELTTPGRELRARAAMDVDTAESQFLAALGEQDARKLKQVLQITVESAGAPVESNGRTQRRRMR